MVDVGIFKGKTKVLTSARLREVGTVDPKMQVSADEYREIRKHHNQQKSRYEQGGNIKGWSDEATSYISDPVE